ncbi:hypothetical protein GGS23DRAFT_558134 [Durotheca rogersii]|uniref:uncharacterized protein n=1 Tax=Durotheca rogersii TaxID=419775 RepID=UPI00221EBC66|nr:uncharacterized protein GGS23DRAFT_558134 [Durotheca rogersii]KAI5865200.1 hypothetical protein GGS23DRAFT_558134 [Durotheca rogersii]
MAETNTSISALALLAEQDPQQLQLRAESLRSLEFAADDSMHDGAFRGVKFPMLERLVLDASDQNEEPASSPHLRILKLKYSVTEQASISPRELIHLAQGLPHAQQLEISGHVQALELESNHMATIAEALPNLRILHLAFECSLTEAALIELGQKCGSEMTDCELWGSYALQNLEGSGVSFPLLLDLVLGKLVPPASGNTDSQAANAARLVKELAPSLSFFDVVAEDSFATLVDTYWRGPA